MITISEFERKFDIERAQLKKLLDQLDAIVKVQDEDGTTIAVDKHLIDLLKKIDNRRNEEMSFQEALEEVLREIDQFEKNSPDNLGSESKVDELQGKLNDLKKENDFLKREIQLEEKRFKKLLPQSRRRCGILKKVWRLIHR